MPLGAGELQLYRAIREAVPILDAAIWKLIRLAGGVAVKCGEPAAQAGWSGSSVLSHRAGTAGHPVFLDCYLDSMLTCGRGVGELVLDCQGREIAALLCAGPEQVEIREGDSPPGLSAVCPGPGRTCEPLPWQELLLFTPFQPETEHPYGVSLLRSMPLPHRHPAEDLPGHGDELGANGQRALRGHLPPRRGRGSLCPGAVPANRRGVVRRHAGGQAGGRAGL